MEVANLKEFPVSGDNNLRRDYETPEQLRHRVVNILEHCNGIENCWVVFTTLIPSIGWYQETKHTFKLFNEIMQSEITKYPYAELCKITRQFYKGEKLDEQFYEDDIHLSASGAEVMARSVFRKLSFLSLE